MTTFGTRWSRLNLDEARRLYDTGLSFEQVGKRLGFTKSYLARRFRAAGVPVRPSGRPVTTPAPPVDPAEIVRRYDAGESFPVIARTLGISTDMARDRYLRAVGRPRRRAKIHKRAGEERNRLRASADDRSPRAGQAAEPDRAREVADGA